MHRKNRIVQEIAMTNPHVYQVRGLLRNSVYQKEHESLILDRDLVITQTNNQIEIRNRQGIIQYIIYRYNNELFIHTRNNRNTQVTIDKDQLKVVDWRSRLTHYIIDPA
jgi:hypothetical protein